MHRPRATGNKPGSEVLSAEDVLSVLSGFTRALCGDSPCYRQMTPDSDSDSEEEERGGGNALDGKLTGPLRKDKKGKPLERPIDSAAFEETFKERWSLHRGARYTSAAYKVCLWRSHHASVSPQSSPKRERAQRCETKLFVGFI
jgi:hypothetical protein